MKNLQLKNFTPEILSIVCFISILVPANFASDLKLSLTNVTEEATSTTSPTDYDEVGIGRDPGIFDLLPKFPLRPFQILSKPSSTTVAPSSSVTTKRTSNAVKNGQKQQQQGIGTVEGMSGGGGGVEIPANLTLQLPVSVGGTTTTEGSGIQAAEGSEGSEGIVPTSSEATSSSWWNQIKYPCACDGGTCGCCTGRVLQNFNFNIQQRGCVNVTYYNEDFEFHVKMIFNDRVYYQRRVSGKNPPPICIPLPRLLNLKFCVKFSNIYMVGRNMHMCIDVEGLLAEYQVFAVSFDCIRLGTQGFAVITPEDGGGLGPPPEEDPYVPPPKPNKPNKPKPPKPQRPQTGSGGDVSGGGGGGSTKPKPPKPGAGTVNKPKPPPIPNGENQNPEDYDAIVASEGDNIDSAKSAVKV